MDSRNNETLGNSEFTLFKHTAIPRPDAGQIELYLSVSETTNTVKCILLAFPKSLSPDTHESQIEHTGEYALSEDGINLLFQDIENIFKKFANPEKHFDSFNTSTDADAINKKSISRIQGTGIVVSNRYLEKMLEIKKSSLLSSIPSKTSGCQIF